ncbi:TonB-dependent receptor plug domain-containing protein [Mucilaginibacter myungsuensis]|uniref:TonB-dependent receptor plug domain-containing protein n=1 Tax=Mucilaginibacter myungsuensis TaxID=649104 RepID=A0A929PX39_9SPHI|nr:TonB-dependent receptor plug domain-containing protein [Mucilaginibacter myungsuensis]MBE9663453.1 TonB-dependent receptor plug domain-containing protein [Mucilaginibacter myungsuensis]MDN3600191.1 TonB-dependent receptor plug domain-containing protein [Mucilaginibacter myungsuensis]
MKKSLTLLLFIFASILSFGQKPLTDSRTNSPYTYIYRLDDASTLLFINEKEDDFKDELLKEPVYKYLTGTKPDLRLAPGNYLEVYASLNKLQYRLIQKPSVIFKQLLNGVDMRFVLLDSTYQEVTTAVVTVGKKQIRYDEVSRSYHTAQKPDKMLIKAVYQGVSNFHQYGENKLDEGYFFGKKKKSSLWSRITAPFSKKSKTKARQTNFPQGTNPGFIIFNKPKYRPNDTVKFKAFILQKGNKKPINDKQLAVRILDSKPGGKLLGTVNAYRKGGFEYQFKLDDSLDLDIDETYRINLEPMGKDGRPVSTDKRADGEYRRDPPGYHTGSFRVEEYELKTNKFTVRKDGYSQSPGVPVPFYFKATDDNGLNVPDARVRIIVRLGYVSEYLNPYDFVRDTLGIFQIPLDAVGETKFMIPDSIFPKLKMNLNVSTQLLNSNNESRVEYHNINWDYDNRTLSAKAEGDSLKMEYLVSGRSTPATATLKEYQHKQEDALVTRTISLPAKIAIDPMLQSYSVKVGELNALHVVSNTGANVDPQGYRTADSLFLHVNNPRKLKFWYTVFGGKKVLAQGSGTELDYKRSYKSSGSVSLLVNFIWGGRPQYLEQQVPYQDRVLNIKVTKPMAVYPGQQAEVVAEVTDHKGKPVAGADITAYGITGKFEQYYGPAIPYLGKTYPYRKLKPFVNEQINPNRDGELKLNWQRWGLAQGLDTISYFQFTHPKDTFKIAEPTSDKLTQIAPFVMKDGEIQPVHILYINDKPVFFDQAQEYPQYSFAVDTLIWSIRMRTKNHLIELQNIKIPAGKKLILAVNADTVQNKIARILPMPDTLTRHESDLMSNYMIKLAPYSLSDRMVTLEQNGRIHLVNSRSSDNYSRNNGSVGVLVGPFAQNKVDLDMKDYLQQSFYSEGNYSFDISPGLIKQKSLPAGYPFDTKLPRNYSYDAYKQYVLTRNAIDTMWQKQLDQRVSNYFNQYSYQSGNTKLYVTAGPLLPKQANYRIKCVLIFKKDDADYLQIVSANNTHFFGYQPGEYRMLYLMDGNSYHIQNNIVVEPNGGNYYNLGAITPHPADSMSNRIGQILIDQIEGASVKACSDAIREAFFDRDPNWLTFNKTMTGRVIDLKDRFPLAGATVTVTGTQHRTVTDKNGRFKLTVPAKGSIRISLDVYDTERAAIRTDTAVTVHLLRTSIIAMRAAMIRGYVRRTREQTTGSSTIITAREDQDKPVANVEQLLQGKVAGLNIQNNTGAPGMRGSVSIRGLSTAGNGTGGNPLYIVDGIPADGNPLQELKQDEITGMEILKDASATALYGSRGAYGVILISTVKGKNKMMPEMAGGGMLLRRNFSDYAYWQPKLSSDAEGKVRFKVTYPDDITNWRTFMVGITDKRQTGFTEGSVKAYKPVSANFTAPQFAIKCDSIATIGKLMNYTADTVAVGRKFKFNGQVLADNKLTIKNAYIDTFKVVASSDSLRFEYTINRPNGYADGEYRAIPVFEQGTLETKGIFKTLERDTAINLTFDANLKEVTLRAEASALPVLLDEVQHLRDYEYLCNEQLASKLKALLAEKQIRAYLKEPFKWDNAIKDLIKRLNENRKGQGVWGWWKDTPEELWISMHVSEALLTAKAQGYEVTVNQRELINYLMFQSDAYKGEDKLRVIALLKMLGSSADLKLIMSRYEKELSLRDMVSDNEKLRLMHARQVIGLPIVIDSLLKGMKTTMFGNVYWGQQGYYLFNNSIQNSLLAYKILRTEGKHPQLLGKLRNYFLEQRGNGSWRNTYESAQILETILPDMLIAGEKPRPASLSISGSKIETVTKFPYEVKLDGNAKLNIQKSGDMSVYITAYQKFWNPNPAKVSGDFTVDTRFDNGRTKITQAKGGDAITLTAEVTARADADMVMVEIPIPAGCSYNGKPQGYGNGEVHREYFKNKVSIFCRKLSAGKHTFTISLMPRYSGNYTVNPAKAEMMYFPVFYGREGMKKLRIE